MKRRYFNLLCVATISNLLVSACNPVTPLRNLPEYVIDNEQENLLSSDVKQAAQIVIEHIHDPKVTDKNGLFGDLANPVSAGEFALDTYHLLVDPATMKSESGSIPLIAFNSNDEAPGIYHMYVFGFTNSSRINNGETQKKLAYLGKIIIDMRNYKLDTNHLDIVVEEFTPNKLLGHTVQVRPAQLKKPLVSQDAGMYALTGQTVSRNVTITYTGLGGYDERYALRAYVLLHDTVL